MIDYRLQLLRRTAAAVVDGAEESVSHARELRARIESERLERRLLKEARQASQQQPHLDSLEVSGGRSGPRSSA